MAIRPFPALRDGPGEARSRCVQVQHLNGAVEDAERLSGARHEHRIQAPAAEQLAVEPGFASGRNLPVAAQREPVANVELRVAPVQIGMERIHQPVIRSCRC